MISCFIILAPHPPHMQWTLASLFAQAAAPERVFVGVVWQADMRHDAAFVRLAGDQRWLPQARCTRVAYAARAQQRRQHHRQRRGRWQQQKPAFCGLHVQVRQIVLHCGEATGPCKARAVAEQLWAGEEFVLQVSEAAAMHRGLRQRGQEKRARNSKLTLSSNQSSACSVARR